MRELFVYYRVGPLEAEAALALVKNLQAALQGEHRGLRARLLRRPAPVDGNETWMETYAMDPLRSPEGIGPALQAEIESRTTPLLPLLAGPRHTEVFVACAS